MNTYNFTSERLAAVVSSLETLNLSYLKKGLTCCNRSETLESIGAMSAILDKLAEVMGGLWLFGADFVDDAEELRRFVDSVIRRAETLAEVADVESLDIIYKSVDGVDYWINKGRQTRENFETAAKYDVNINVVECLRDIETLTAEEARQKYTAEDLANADELAKREAGRAWDDLDSGRSPYRITSDGHIIEIESGNRAGAWFGNGFVSYNVYFLRESFFCDTLEDMENEIIKRHNNYINRL